MMHRLPNNAAVTRADRDAMGECSCCLERLFLQHFPSSCCSLPLRMVSSVLARETEAEAHVSLSMPVPFPAAAYLM